jgi:hypothetical protein
MAKVITVDSQKYGGSRSGYEEDGRLQDVDFREKLLKGLSFTIALKAIVRK